MRPSSSYKLYEPADFQEVHAFLDWQRPDEDIVLSFPTVIARSKDGSIVGLMGTDTRGGVTLAGPLVLTGERNRLPTVLRLMQAYENILKLVGATHYTFAIDCYNEVLDKLARKVVGQPWAVRNGKSWYTREVK